MSWQSVYGYHTSRYHLTVPAAVCHHSFEVLYTIQLLALDNLQLPIHVIQSTTVKP